MNIITVIPLTRSKMLDTLSYFTASDVPVGAIVSVPLRSKSIEAVVVESRPAEDMKSDIRGASYELKKLGKVKATTFFPVTFMEACKKITRYYATNMGAVIDAIVSDTLLENAHKIETPLKLDAKISVIHQDQENSQPLESDPNSSDASTKVEVENIEDDRVITTTSRTSETYAIQGDDNDRISTWRSMIRQEFARKKSVVMYVPTIEDAKQLEAGLTKGIEGYIFTLYGGMNKKGIIETWSSIAKTEHSVVIIATSSFSVLPRNDIDTVIIERENSRGWVSQKNPYLDMRYAIETIARQGGQTVYLADSMLRVETLHRLELNEISSGSPFKWRSISNAKDLLVDMKAVRQSEGQTHSKENLQGGSVKSVSHQSKNSSPGLTGRDADSHGDAYLDKQELNSDISRVVTSNFRVLSPELEALIRSNRDESTHLFILTMRRGLSPTTVCDDCETVVSCRNCSAPVVLHTSKENSQSDGKQGASENKQVRNFFMCHKCGDRRSASEVCVNCGSWRLTPLGIGIDRVHEEIATHFPDVEVYKMDADTTKTSTQISDTLNKFRTRPGSVLLGTEMALSYLGESIDHVAIASLDSLFALPDFRIQEKIMYTLIRLRHIASRSFIVQTRKAEEKVFDYGMKGNLSDFYRFTLEERKQFSYPPFSILVKITLEGTKEAISGTMAEVVKILDPREVDIFPAFTSTVRGKSVIHGLMKVESHAWPDIALADKLRTLPPETKIKINPETLL